jgi:hypothetical protein
MKGAARGVDYLPDIMLGDRRLSATSNHRVTSYPGLLLLKAGENGALATSRACNV